MRNLLEVLITAKKKSIFKTIEEFIIQLDAIKKSDSELELDWDDGAGEEWAMISHKEHGIVYMINTKIGIIFARKSYVPEIPDEFLSLYEIAVVDNYDDEWFVDITELKESIPEIYWRVSEDSVNVNCFSLKDLYFATV